MIVGKSRGLTGSDYADVIELHTLRNLLKEKLKERDFVFVSNFSLQADNCIRVIFRKRKQTDKFNLTRVSSNPYRQTSLFPIFTSNIFSSFFHYHNILNMCLYCISIVFAAEVSWVFVTQLPPDRALQLQHLPPPSTILSLKGEMQSPTMRAAHPKNCSNFFLKTCI